MTTADRRFLAVVSAVVLLLLLLTGCDPGRGPRDNRPPGHPPNDDPPAAVPVIYDVYFVVEVSGPAPGYRPYVRDVLMEISALQRDGQFAKRIDPTTGQQLPNPTEITRKTTLPPDPPLRYGVTLGVGVVSASLTATYLGDAGDRLRCYVERDGVELPTSRQEKRIEYTPTGRGGVQVYCYHFATTG